MSLSVPASASVGIGLVPICMHTQATQRENFFKEVDGADDGFLAVAKYFGNGMFQKSMQTQPASAASSAGAASAATVAKSRPAMTQPTSRPPVSMDDL